MSSTSKDGPVSAFLRPEEVELGERFMRDGYVIVEAEDRAALERIRSHIVSVAATHLGIDPPNDPDAFLNRIHERVDVPRLNGLRLAVVNGLKSSPWFRPCYFALARRTIELIVGNELAMQRGIGLSVQLPADSSSLLHIHTDVWDGDSAFEVVLWVPMVDCFRTKAMYLVPPAKDRPFQNAMHKYQDRDAEDLYQAVKDAADFVPIKYGQVLLFSQTLMHGNRVNEENETRWSMNCRFKGLLSPYADKKVGEFFEPITLRPATRIGLDYSLPGGFEE
jgi:sporadic carbohydrate cluster 2OG-Fe(II) oxygenase